MTNKKMDELKKRFYQKYYYYFDEPGAIDAIWKFIKQAVLEASETGFSKGWDARQRLEKK